jgi:hypothetical protein
MDVGTADTAIESTTDASVDPSNPRASMHSSISTDNLQVSSSEIPVALDAQQGLEVANQTSSDHFLGVVDLDDQSEHCLLFKVRVPYEDNYKDVEFVFDLFEDDPEMIVEEIYGLEELSFLTKYAKELVEAITPVVKVAKSIATNRNLTITNSQSLSTLVLKEVLTISDVKNVPHELAGLLSIAEQRIGRETIVNSLHSENEFIGMSLGNPQSVSRSNSNPNTQQTIQSLASSHSRSVSVPIFPSNVSLGEVASSLAHDRALSDSTPAASSLASLSLDDADGDEERKQIVLKYNEGVARY